MLFRKPLPVWMYVILFVVSCLLIPLANRLRSRPIDPPRTLSELRSRLSRCAPPLYTVWYFEDNPENGIWICAQPPSRKQLPILFRHPIHANHWKGFVFCERISKQCTIPEGTIRDWGEHAMQIGPLLFFGDPDLLRRIRKAIEGEHYA